MVLQGREHRVAHDFIEPLRRGGEFFEVVVVEGPRQGVVEDLAVEVVRDDVHGVRRPAVGQRLAREHDGIPGIADLDSPRGPVGGLVPDLRRDEGPGVLVQGTPDLVRVCSALNQAQFSADILEAAQADDPRDGPPRLFKSAVHNERIDFVREGAGLTVLAVMADLPSQGRFALLGRLPQFDGDASLFGEPVDGIAGQGGLDPDHVQGGSLSSSLQAVFFLHSRTSKNTTTIRRLVGVAFS